MKPLLMLPVMLLQASALLNADVMYNISLDTSSLVSGPAGPFSISFQLSDGSGTGDGNNAAIINNFAFGTGGPTGAPILLGSAFGDLTSGVVLTDASGIGFFAQTFIPGSILDFQLFLTTNLDTGPTADALTFSILDKTLTPIPTTAGAPFDTLMQIDITSDNPAVITFAGDTSRSPAAGGGPINIPRPQLTSAVAEPGVSSLFAVGLFLIALGNWKRHREMRSTLFHEERRKGLITTN